MGQNMFVHTMLSNLSLRESINLQIRLLFVSAGNLGRQDKYGAMPCQMSGAEKQKERYLCYRVLKDSYSCS